MPRYLFPIDTKNKRNHSSENKIVISALIICLLLSFFSATIIVHAQTGFITPVRVSTNTEYVKDPQLLADKQGNLHLFWIEDTGQESTQSSVINYSALSQAGWSFPVDIVVSPSGRGISGFSVTIDPYGIVHMILVSENNYYTYYTTVSISELQNPSAWSPVDILVFEPASSAQIISSGDYLYLVYSSLSYPYETYFIRSDDSGVTWSEPLKISDAQSSGEISTSASLATDADNVIHAVWVQNTYPEGYPPLRVMYSRSENNGETWSKPYELRAGHYGAPSILISPENVVYVTYNGSGDTAGRYVISSSDGGVSWGHTVTIDPGVGGLTGGSMAIDSNGTIHYTSASDAIQYNGIAYSRYFNGQWSPMSNILEPFLGIDTKNRQAFEPKIVITRGNQLHLVYIGRNHDEIYYTYTGTGSPEDITAQSEYILMPTFVASEPTEGSQILATPTATLIPFPDDNTNGQSTSIGLPLVAGSLASVIFIGIFLLIRYRGNR